MEKYQEEDATLTNLIQKSLETFITSLGFGNIAIVTKVNAKTINCKPVISKLVNGNKVDFPELVEVPVIHLYGGNTVLRMPITVGDYCYLNINERCFDNWWAGQDFQTPRELRFNDYSDAVALVGLRPLSTGFDIPTTATFDGDLIHNGNLTHNGNTTQTGNIEQTGNNNITGNLDVSQTISATNFTGRNGGAMASNVDFETTQNVEAGTYSVNGNDGASGTFSTGTNTVTVENGIITQIS